MTTTRQVDARLDHLVNLQGMNQLDACRMLWGSTDPSAFADEPLPPVQPATPAQWQLWSTAWVKHRTRVVFADVLAWLAKGLVP